MGLNEAGGRGGRAIEGGYGHIEIFCSNVGFGRIWSEFMRRNDKGKMV